MDVILISIAVNALLIALVYLLARKRINRLLGGEEALDAIKQEINRLIVELNQTADRNIGIIEARIARLKKLVEESDRKIALLGKESEKVRIGAEVYERLKRSRPLVPEENRSAAGTETLPPDSQRPLEEQSVSYAVAPAGGGEHREPMAGGAAPPGGGGMTARVLELHRQGFEPKIIASRTGSTLGEIELIISLAAGNR
ncbi:MAG: hypothetical protein JW852_06925 [Spirochaetales bacterium]|nr:hypothetical protein [Spirochaetales bacterium]